MITYVLLLLCCIAIITFLVVNYFSIKNKVITRDIIDNIFAGTASITPRDIHAYETLIYILSKKESRRILNPSEMVMKLQEALNMRLLEKEAQEAGFFTNVPRKSSYYLPSILDQHGSSSIENDPDFDFNDDPTGRTCYMKMDTSTGRDYYWQVPENEVVWDRPTDCNCFVSVPDDSSLPSESWDETSSNWVSPNRCEPFLNR